MPRERSELVFWICCWILLFCPPKNALFCGSTRTLSVDEGEDVILESNPRPSLSYITWDYEKHIIAFTAPRGPLQLGEYGYKYSGRLSSFNDGSLMIANLTAEDGQIYRADLFDVNNQYLCVQVYDLRTVDSLESCSPTKQLLYALGGNVVFRLPSHPKVSYAAWDINNIDHIAITRPGGITYRQNPSYHGKMSVMGDGSLKLSHLTSKDQQIYRAEHFNDKWSHLCTQHYDVRVKRIIEGLPGIFGLQTHIRLALAACILLATLSILLYHIKTEHSRTPQ
ncbi:uncharacterized protein LOC130295085 isoform X2 [Hyla sarda]|uniref:uncharacterized protein LOC130295085 isoform X2 n=1 Tax=Hyla sarda TaxID=327740 RepID=UPI0024C3ECA5|nr:uncharacterized protein LOC130295085 isoform X2 [Hyla sarda]